MVKYCISSAYVNIISASQKSLLIMKITLVNGPINNTFTAFINISYCNFLRSKTASVNKRH